LIRSPSDEGGPGLLLPDKVLRSDNIGSLRGDLRWRWLGDIIVKMETAARLASRQARAFKSFITTVIAIS